MVVFNVFFRMLTLCIARMVLSFTKEKGNEVFEDGT